MGEPKLTLGNINFGQPGNKFSPIFDRTTSIDTIVKDAIAKEMAIKENFIARYLAETGAKVQDTMLVEQRMGYDMQGGSTTRYWCAPKPRRNVMADDKVKKLRRVEELAATMATAQAEMNTIMAEILQGDDNVGA